MQVDKKTESLIDKVLFNKQETKRSSNVPSQPAASNRSRVPTQRTSQRSAVVEEPQLTRAEIRAQMVAMKTSINTMYKNNSKYGMNEPKIDMPDEGRLSAMSMTMTSQLKRSIKSGRKSVQHMGPHMASAAKDKQMIFVVTNDAHNANTNNGFTRKPNGGFYYH